MTALLRRLVERELRGQRKSHDDANDAIMALADVGRSGQSDISEKHDEALAEALRGETVRCYERVLRLPTAVIATIAGFCPRFGPVSGPMRS